jgi:hypothetical protein
VTDVDTVGSSGKIVAGTEAAAVNSLGLEALTTLH